MKCAGKIETTMNTILPKATGMEGSLLEAMRYSCLGGGKRLRPFMVEQSSRLFGIEGDTVNRIGAAVEFLHCYSLIHDDLPAMDDSDLRRGKESCHKKFNEETAILAGDALLTLAFETLADKKTHSADEVRCNLVYELARAAGAQGMVAGQMMDLVAEGTDLHTEQITRLERLKTGKIFSFCMLAGGIVGRAQQQELTALREYADGFGIAFQIIDDLLDVEANSRNTGKPAGQDAIAKKATFVSILGVEEARNKAVLLIDRSIAALEAWGGEADHLRALGRYILKRPG